MRKLILTMFLVFLAVGVCIAAPYWLPQQYYNSDQQITTTRTVLYDMTIYWTNATVGDKIDFRNGISTSSTAFYTFIAPTAHGTFYYRPERDLVADQGIYFDVSGTAGSVMGVSIKYQ